MLLLATELVTTTNGGIGIGIAVAIATLFYWIGRNRKT